jgi:hypothetical protein
MGYSIKKDYKPKPPSDEGEGPLAVEGEKRKKPLP